MTRILAPCGAAAIAFALFIGIPTTAMAKSSGDCVDDTLQHLSAPPVGAKLEVRVRQLLSDLSEADLSKADAYLRAHPEEHKIVSRQTWSLMHDWHAAKGDLLIMVIAQCHGALPWNDEAEMNRLSAETKSIETQLAAFAREYRRRASLPQP